MICYGYINKSVFEKIKNEEISDDFLKFFNSLIEDYDDGNSSIIIVDDLKNSFLNNIIILSRSAKNLRVRALFESMLTRIKNFEVKPLIKSTNKEPNKSNYVDFYITSESEQDNKSIEVNDKELNLKIKKIKNKYRKSILSNSFRENKFKSLCNTLERIFLASRNINLLRTSMGEQLVPYNDNYGFSKIENAGSTKKGHFHTALSTLYLLINLVSNIKNEGFFLDEDREIVFNIYTDIDHSNIYSRNDVIDDEMKKEVIDVLDHNLSIYKPLKKALIRNKIKLNLKFFIYSSNENESLRFEDRSTVREEIKGLLHTRRLYCSNGSFIIGHENLITGIINNRGEFIKISKIGTFNVEKIDNIAQEDVKSSIFDNYFGISQIKYTYPN